MTGRLSHRDIRAAGNSGDHHGSRNQKTIIEANHDRLQKGGKVSLRWAPSHAIGMAAEIQAGN
jgi:hypothetical protein